MAQTVAEIRAQVEATKAVEKYSAVVEIELLISVSANSAEEAQNKIAWLLSNHISKKDLSTQKFEVEYCGNSITRPESGDDAHEMLHKVRMEKLDDQIALLKKATGA